MSQKSSEGQADSESGQLAKFKQAACDLECDEDEEAFKRSLRKVAKAKLVKPK